MTAEITSEASSASPNESTWKSVERISSASDQQQRVGDQQQDEARHEHERQSQRRQHRRQDRVEHRDQRRDEERGAGRGRARGLAGSRPRPTRPRRRRPRRRSCARAAGAAPAAPTGRARRSSRSSEHHPAGRSPRTSSHRDDAKSRRREIVAITGGRHAPVGVRPRWRNRLSRREESTAAMSTSPESGDALLRARGRDDLKAETRRPRSRASSPHPSFPAAVAGRSASA